MSEQLFLKHESTTSVYILQTQIYNAHLQIPRKCLYMRPKTPLNREGLITHRRVMINRNWQPLICICLCKFSCLVFVFVFVIVFTLVCSKPRELSQPRVMINWNWQPLICGLHNWIDVFSVTWTIIFSSLQWTSNHLGLLKGQWW